MEIQSGHWLPLNEYALRSGVSISTLRRKIKANSIEYKMEDGRYLIRGDDLFEVARGGFSSSDDRISPSIPLTRPPSSSASASSASPAITQKEPPVPRASMSSSAALEELREEIRRVQEENLLRWKALEARVAGLAKKLEFFTEQMAETKMLVKIFEEKLDSRV